MKKRLFLLGALLLVVACVWAQERYTYAYDVAGNRVGRTIVMHTMQAAHAVEPSKAVFFEERLAKQQIKIYPNPVRSVLTIALEQFDETWQPAGFSMSGQLLHNGHIRGLTTRVNMSHYSSGMYVLRLLLKGKQSTWKIIKE